MQLSVRVRNARADQLESTVGTAPRFQLFNGAMPANCGVADAGVKLVDTALPSDWMAASSGGTKAKSGTWNLTGIATGEARYFRIYDSGGTNCDAQGLVGQNWAASTAYPTNKHVINDSGKVYRCATAGTTASSGGPTGTGTGITDGSAVWDYVGLADQTMDNTNVAPSQQVTVNTFSWTEGNA